MDTAPADTAPTETPAETGNTEIGGSAERCPRCGMEIEAEFYGPCGACVTELRALFSPGARSVGEVEYVPKMNVTPNAVALKDD